MDQVVQAEDGVWLWATKAGQGTPVVLCHGGPGLWDTLGDVAELLQSSVTVHRWDQRGCGRSQRSGPYTVARTVTDLDAVRRYFGLEQMALLGHSWGAQLALLYALEHPDRVSRLVYVSGTGIDPGSPWRDSYELNLRQGLSDDLDRWEALRNRDRTDEEDRELCVLQWSVDFADRDRHRAREHAERMATPWFGVNFECNGTIGAEAKLLLASANLQERCRSLHVPTLIVDGTEDVRPRWSVDSLERALPSVARVALTGAGHLPWVEDPSRFRHTVSAFLTRDGQRPD